MAVVVDGIIKHAYPLQELRHTDDHGDDTDGAFSLGPGPCGRDATQVVAWEVILREPPMACYVFLYDEWAAAVRRFQRHYKVRLSGPGLVAVDHWDVGHDTEDIQRCVLVAAPRLLARAAERLPRGLALPTAGVAIAVAYEEPQRVPESEQVRYLPEEVIHARELYGHRETTATTTTRTANCPQATTATPMPAKDTGARDRGNPRGKRSLRTISPTSPAATAAYMYTPLGELIPGYANVYGVVVNVSLPKRSHGADYYMSVHVIDESCPKHDDAVQIMVFFPRLDQMPRILHVGDVVRFHKVRINRYQDRLQGVSSPKATRYLVLRRSTDGGIEQQTCSSSWTFEAYDQARFEQLEAWAALALQVDVSLPPGCPRAPLLLADMEQAPEFTDVLVRVLHIQTPHEEAVSARMIVWDGSGDSAACRDLYDKLQREDARWIPSEGLLMEVIIDSCWIVLQEMGFLAPLSAGTWWCRFRNLSVSSETGDATLGAAHLHWFELHFREVSSLILVPEVVPGVQVRLPHQDQIPTPAAAHQTAHTQLAVFTSVPQFVLEKAPVTSISAIVANPHVPRKYLCSARVLTIWPTDVEKFVKVTSSANANTQYIYSFVLRLGDDSGVLDVIAHGSDAAAFLCDIPPCDFSQDPKARMLLSRRIATILRHPDALRFCIKSYLPVGKSEARYRLFDTVLSVSG